MIAFASVCDLIAIICYEVPAPLAVDIAVLPKRHVSLLSSFEMKEQYSTHLFTYRHDGGEWVLAIKATDANDARARIGKLAYASYDGVAVSEMPAVLAPFGILSVWARNTAIVLLKRFSKAC